tara:strand:+ start:373 stop:603 length:231 start_codon:yes stop_codon:yes gene_type:complete
MPIYPVINTKTGEKQELNLTIAKYEQWRKDNPDWDKDWMAGVASEMYGKPKVDDGFKEVMSKVQSAHPLANLSGYT